MEEVGALCTRLEDCDALTSWLIGGLNIFEHCAALCSWMRMQACMACRLAMLV